MTASPPIAPLRVLVVDDEANIRLTLSMCLKAEGHYVVAQGTIDDALASAATEAFDLIFLDLRLGTENGLDFIPQLLEQNPWTRIIVITAYASVDTAVEAMKRGASDYLAKPFEAAEVQLVTRSVAERRQLERHIEALRAAMDETDVEADLPTSSPVMQAAFELARQVAPSRANLLIHGETGTGKERLARAIHVWSNRASEPFAIICCQSDRDDALETELFGASVSDERSSAKAEFCRGGTLVLEEVGKLPARLQPMVVRLLKDQEFERQDEVTRRRTDVRIIGTTTEDLQKAVEQGRFRSDLLLALNVVQIDLQPLRERPADIPLLAERYLAHFSRLNRMQITGFTSQASYVLARHAWPGNARELRNVIERAVLLCTSNLIGVEHLPGNLLNVPPNISIGDLIPLAAIEEWHIRRVVNATRSLRQAASILGIDSGTLVRRMRRYESKDDQPAA